MNTLKYIIVGVVLYTITACTATHYTVIENKGYTIPVTERLDASPDASVAEIINIYKTKVLDISADGYKGLYHLMDSIAIKGRKLHYINPKRAEIFFNTIFVETK